MPGPMMFLHSHMIPQGGMMPPMLGGAQGASSPIAAFIQRLIQKRMQAAQPQLDLTSDDDDDTSGESSEDADSQDMMPRMLPFVGP